MQPCGLFSSSGEQGLLSNGGTQASLFDGFSYCGARALGCVGFSSRGSQALEHRFNSCGAWASLFLGVWNLPRSHIKPLSPALAGRFFSTEPSGKPHLEAFEKNHSVTKSSDWNGFL